MSSCPDILLFAPPPVPSPLNESVRSSVPFATLYLWLVDWTPAFMPPFFWKQRGERRLVPQ